MLCVDDVQKTLDFYVNSLGWSDPWTWGDPPDFAGCSGFSELEMRLVDQPGDVHGYPMHVTASEIAKLYQTHSERGITVIRDLGPQAWGEFGYVVEDLNGYHIRFTEREPDQRQGAACLVVPDLESALAYYRDVLGFANVSYWGDPPVFARVEEPARLEFCENAELANRSPLHMISIYGDGVDESYKKHVANGVELVDELEAMPWGLKQYVVQDPNGFLLRFGEEYEPCE